MRIVLRLLGLAFVVAALLVLGGDLAGSGAGGGPSGDQGLRPLGALWYELHAGSLNLAQAVIERYVWAALWDPVLIAVLQWPAALVFGVLGAVLFGLGFLPRRGRAETPPGAQPAERDAGTPPPPA